MDLVSSFAGIQNTYTNFYGNTSNYSFHGQQAQKSADAEISTNATTKIVLVQKGSSGYMTDFDLDEDGKITLEEFNKYCEENGINSKDKIKLMTTMEFSKIKEKLIAENVDKSEDENTKTNSEEKDSQNENDSIYAKKGDDNYNEKMDKNKDNVITYAEYLSYKFEQEENNNSTNDSKKLYSDKQQQPESSEKISTFEYEV